MKKLVLCISLILPTWAFAQNSHYWSQGFGAKQTFLSGSMISTVNDNSAVFYNPAGIGNLASPEISINANVYGLSMFYIENGLGEGNDLSSIRALLFPQFMGGSIKLKDSKFSMVVAYMSRHYAKNRIAIFDTQIKDYIPSANGNEIYNINLDLETLLHEQWGGVGLGYQVNEKLYLGASGFVTYRNQKNQSLYSRTLVSQDGVTFDPISINSSQRTVIDIFSLLFKAGIQYHSGPLSFGGTITLPNINVVKFANGRFNETVTNVEQYYPVRTDGEIFERNSSYKTKYKSPLSIAAGMSFEKGKNTWHLTAEYFTPIKEYTVAIPKNPYHFASPTDKSSEYQTTLSKGSLLIAETSARGIFNVALGLERRVNDKITMNYGFRTDFNYFNGNNENNVQFDRDLWDLYHFTIGVSSEHKQVITTIGLDNAFGYHKNISAFGDANIPNFEDENLSATVTGKSTVYTYVGMLVIGVTKLF